MSAYILDVAMLPGGWARAVRVSVDAAGWITGVEPDAAPHPDDQHLRGIVIPGMANVHSHAFQRAMAGRAERGGTGDFWRWRDVMYALAARLGPDALRAVAAHLYAEMLEAGYTAVAEFHYLHAAVDDDGPRCMSAALVDAAADAGIGLTLLPVLYQRAGFDGGPLAPAQQGFALDTARYLALLDALAAKHNAQMTTGVAFHSLRAVDAAALNEVVAAIDNDTPVHIHVAEQRREVDDCQQHLGARPVQWLLDNQPVDPRWCLVHATHTDPGELEGIVSRGASVGLCPSTEANLGDGFFALERFEALGGRWAIGSDSQVCIDPTEELRWLEYGARLQAQRRCIVSTAQAPHAGARLYRAALAGADGILGRRVGAIAPGYRADLVALDDRHPLHAGLDGDARLDCHVFASPPRTVRDVICGGRWRVRDGRHEHIDALAHAARSAPGAFDAQ